MPNTFLRSMRSLTADSFRLSTAGLLLAVAILGPWSFWFYLTRVAVYEVSHRARLELVQAAYPIQALATGRVVATRLLLGREFQAKEVVVELDTESQRRQLQEEQARLEALSSQLPLLQSEAAAEEQAGHDELEAGRAASDKARARLREAEAGAAFAKEKAERLGLGYTQGVTGELELLQVKADERQRRAAVDGELLEINRMEQDQRTKQSERRARIERLKREIARIRGEMTIAAAEINRLGYEIEKSRIFAPANGRIGEVANFRVGSVVREGERLGAVVPVGKLGIVADFLPEAAFGRIRPGQPAQLRLHGFPWTQYGAVSASVQTVASEVREGMVRVELAIHENDTPSIPFQHGLPGTVEIQVERVSPATLVLRAVGKLLAKPAAAGK